MTINKMQSSKMLFFQELRRKFRRDPLPVEPEPVKPVDPPRQMGLAEYLAARKRREVTR